MLRCGNLNKIYTKQTPSSSLVVAAADSHVLVHHLLLVDQVRRLLHQGHQLRDVVRPLVELLVGVHRLVEVDHA